MAEGEIKQETRKMAGGGAMPINAKVDFKVIQYYLGIYAFAAELVKGKVVLDVACGAGYGSSYLFDKGAKEVVGGDITVEAIEAAQKFYGREGVEFRVLDATKLPFADESFDAITSMETIEHLEQYRDYLSECKRVLKKGGIFICSTPNKGHGISEVKEFSPFHVHEFYVEEFKDLLSEFFTGTQFYGHGYWREAEKTGWKIRIRIEKAITPLLKSIPKLYEAARYLDRRLIKRVHYTQLSQIADLDKILTGKEKPFRLVASSPVPKTIIAVARK